MSTRGTGTDDGDPTSTTDAGSTADGGDDTVTTRFGTEQSVDYLRWAGVIVLAVTALVALAGFYTGVSRTISIWVTREYRPLVNAAFNLALLLIALGGIGRLLRRDD